MDFEVYMLTWFRWNETINMNTTVSGSGVDVMADQYGQIIQAWLVQSQTYGVKAKLAGLRFYKWSRCCCWESYRIMLPDTTCVKQHYGDAGKKQLAYLQKLLASKKSNHFEERQ